ncbi:MAG: hypothetical protein ABUL62_04480 [Myxococcales bacterium]
MMNARWSFLAVPLLAALGCSDPVPLPAQGAITLSVRLPANTTSGTCPDSGTTYESGSPAPSTGNPGGSLVDGDKGARVSCSVKPSGGGFAFSGNFAANTTSGESFPITVTFSNGVIDANGNGTADIGVYTPKLSQTYSSSVACTVNVLGSPKQVKGGSIWASFSCPSITNPPSGLCAVGSNSVVVFENCDGS